MSEGDKLMCKVLIYEKDRSTLKELRTFLKENDLIGLRVDSKDILEVLESNIDLGAVFLSDGEEGLELGEQIHLIRRELPIFIRINPNSDAESLPTNTFAGFYYSGQMDKLKEMVGSYLFNTQYPNGLIRGIQEITIDTLQTELNDTVVSCDTPYIVKDRIIFGQVFSLMSLETNWCRGYMMLQTEEASIEKIIRLQKTHLNPDDDPVDFRLVNSVLGEISNRIWGGMKTRYVNESELEDPGYRVQVPIIINHEKRYISFSSDEGQLCLRYRISDANNNFAPVIIFQKFVFHLNWDPEKFTENEKSIDDFVDSGELELF